jgi:hypothetical protein
MADGVKKPWLSKTLWMNAIMAVSALFLPGVGEWITAHPMEILYIVTGLNFLLRFVSKGKIQLSDDSQG